LPRRDETRTRKSLARTAEGQGRQPTSAGAPVPRLRWLLRRAVYTSLKDALKFARGRSLLPAHRKPPVICLTSTSPVRYNFAVMPLYPTLTHVPPSFSPSPCVWPASARHCRLSAWPIPSSVSWRHSVPETLKSDIKNEAVNLLKTKDWKFEFSRSEAVNALITGRLAKMEGDTKSR
jgi:hypothetical protein